MRATSPRITVLIPTYNRAEFLEECLESLLNQTLPAFQIIVVNDGSTDDTRQILTSYFDKIEYFETDQLGKPGALNYGLTKVKGDYLWIFDDDDVALSDALARFVAPLEKHPEFGFSYSTFYYTNSDENGRIGDNKRELKIPDVTKRGFLIPLLEWNFLGGAGIFVRTSSYHEVGVFNTELIRSQDYEMALRLALKFEGVLVEGGPTFHYRQHDGLRGHSQDRFHVEETKLKWLEYDKKIFRNLYDELDLSNYLYPSEDIKLHERKALLQRCAVMGYKYLYLQMMRDLGIIAKLNDLKPFSRQEYDVIWSMLFNSFYDGKGCMFDRVTVFDAVGCLAKKSGCMKLLRNKMCRMVLSKSLRQPRDFHQLLKSLFRVFRLYFPEDI